MSLHPTLIERAFAIAESGHVDSVNDLQKILKAEGHWELRQLSGRAIRAQLLKIIVKAKTKVTD